LRLTSDGKIPDDNPFSNAVYSYGHRNVQGLVWDDQGQLWATEHGRSGVRSGYDEINKIDKGMNYGWPNIEGDETQSGMVGPVVHSGASETWAPSGMTYLNGKIIFAGLRGESLYIGEVERGGITNLEAVLRGDYGRLRTVTVGPDGMLYILTSNRDGRGQPDSSDDRIIKLDPRSVGI
jgi:glucose/arabinose dehydrogenase